MHMDMIMTIGDEYKPKQEIYKEFNNPANKFFNKCTLQMIIYPGYTFFCTCFSGSHPELHTCWRRCSWNSSRVHADALWLSYCRFLLWHHFHTWIYLSHGMLFFFLLMLSFQMLSDFTPWSLLMTT